MADILDVTVTVKKNGVLLAGFPRQQRLTIDEIQEFAYEKATGGGYETLPVTQIASVQALILTANQAITLRLDGQSDAGIVLNTNSLVLILNGTIDAGASVNATIDNSSGATALVQGLGAGT